MPAAAMRGPVPGVAPATITTIFIDVRSARDSLSSKGPRQNQSVTTYRWLLNYDTTGDPSYGQDSLYCHPSSNVTSDQATALHLPATGLGVTYVITTTGYPQGCYWPSIKYATASPALSEGTQVDWSTGTALPVGGIFGAMGVTGLPTNCPTVAQPIKPCKYLVTVESNGYEIGGTHFQVPSTTSTVQVFLNPYPLPLGTVRLKAFADVSPTDGTYDEATEKGLVGFHGLLFDVDGIVQADYFGNPLCTQYLTYQNTTKGAPGYTADPALDGQVVLDQSTGRPVRLAAKDPAPPNPKSGYWNPTVPGDCLSDTNGDIVIPNMPPNHYSSNVTPPIGGQSCIDLLSVVNAQWECNTNFKQTTTLEGNHDFDTWVMPNETGLDTELVVGGEPVPFVQFGFAQEKAQPAEWGTGCVSGVAGSGNGCGRITGQLYQANSYVPGYGALPGVNGANGTSGIKLQNPIDRGWVALNNLNTSSGDYDTMVATIPTQDPSRPGLQYPDCPSAPTYANPTTPGWGCFEFPTVPDGEYMLTIWDEPQETALDHFNVSISNGQIINMGVLPLLGWFSHVSGKVCVDTNGNGRCDPGEKGIPHQVLQNLNRTNNSMVGGINTSQTDNNGNYDFKEAYPLGLMSINQFFFTRFKTTGVTWQACNDPQEHTVVAPMVDVAYLPMIGQCGRLDWAVVPYGPSVNGDNGGIVATQREDYTRQKYNARQAQTNDFSTGIAGFTFSQYRPVQGFGPGGTDAMSGYALAADGSFCTVPSAAGPSTGTVYDKNGGTQVGTCGTYDTANYQLSYISENNGPPAQCYPQDANGNPIGYVPGNVNSYDFMVSGGTCIESGASGTQFGLGTDNTATHPVQTVDGNYTLGNIPGIVPAAQLGDVLVKNTAPVDNVLPAGYCYNPQKPSLIYAPAVGQSCGTGDSYSPDPRPLFVHTTEESVNLFTGAQFIPQGGDTSNLQWPPPAGGGTTMAPIQNNCKVTPLGPVCATPDGGYDENQYTMSPGIDPICAGGTHVVHVAPGSDLAANGGSPLENTTRHLCDTKLLTIRAGQSIAPDFHVHTVVDIPLPAHFWGYIVDDVSVDTNHKSYNLGEVHGIPAVPVGVYDWTGRRVANVTSDYNGAWEILMPSSDIFNCLTPAGTCPNVYRFVGNDPGQPGHPNLNYDPNYRTIAANFEAWPNMLVPADTAPTRIVTGLEGPGLQFSSTSPCGVSMVEPQIFAIGQKPYTKAQARRPDLLTITGVDFGAAPGVVMYTPNPTSEGNTPAGIPLPIVSWGLTGKSITVRVGQGVGASRTSEGMQGGSGSITVTSLNGLTSPSGVGFSVIGEGYNPHIVEVGPGKQFDPFPQLLTHLTQPITPGSVDHISVTALPYSIGFGDTVEVTANGHSIALAASNPEISGEQGVVGANPIPQGATEIDVDQSSTSNYTFPAGSAVTLIRNYAVQDALDYAGYSWQAYWATHSHNVNAAGNQWLVVVYPKWDTTGLHNPAFTPLGTYFENVIIHSPLRLQGVGPGGIYNDGTVMQGSILDGRFWSSIGPGLTDLATPTEVLDTAIVTPPEPATVHWTAIADYLNMIGLGFTAATLANPLNDRDGITGADMETATGAVVTEVALAGTQPTTMRYAPAVDGFTITGGNQADFPGNITEVSGTRTARFAEGVEAGTPGPATQNAQADAIGAVEVQGGAVYVNGGTQNLRITNNLVRQNSSTYGTVRFGTQFQGDPQMTGGANHNHDAVISHNQFVANGGTNLAGAIGMFDDSNGYSIDHNTFCMNVSAEYGGAISHYGYSPDGSISYNRMLFNSAFDEGGAVTIASEPGYRIVNNGVTLEAFPDPAVFTQGTGQVSVDHNYISDNMAQDDGGAFRIMGTAGTGARLGAPAQGGDVENENPDRFQPTPTSGAPDLGRISLTNNVISNNVTGHEGGAISIADTPAIEIVNNSITQNVSTATATTSDGLPSPGGIAVDINSAGLNTFLKKIDPQGQHIPDWMKPAFTSTWPTFSNARIWNDILWYNRAGSWGQNAGVLGIGMPGDATAINFWDVGSSDAAIQLTVSYSVIGSLPSASSQQYIAGPGLDFTHTPPTNGLCQNNQLVPGTTLLNTSWCGQGAYNYPNFTNPYATVLSIVQQRTYFRFRPAAIVSIDLPPNLFDIATYRIGASPAQSIGNNPCGVSVVPRNDIESRHRPWPPVNVDAGAYQLTPVTGSPGGCREVEG